MQLNLRLTNQSARMEFDGSDFIEFINSSFFFVLWLLFPFQRKENQAVQNKQTNMIKDDCGKIPKNSVLKNPEVILKFVIDAQCKTV